MDTLGEVLDAMIETVSGDRDERTLDALTARASAMLGAVDESSTRAELALQLGDELARNAVALGFPPLFGRALHVYDAGLEKLSPERDADRWRRLMTHRANTLQRSGRVNASASELQRSIDAYEEVLGTLGETADAVRAVVLSNAASATLLLARLRGGARDLDGAVSAASGACRAIGEGGSPLERCMARTGLANALRLRGTVQASGSDLAEAVTLYEAVLDDGERTAIPPEDRAMVLNGLGIARFRQSELDGRGEWLDAASAAHLEAREIYEQIGPPLERARTSLNLGNVLVRRGERGDPLALREAVTCYEEASAVLDPSVSLADWLDARTNAANALLQLGELEHDLDAMLAGHRAFADVAARVSLKSDPARWRENAINTAIAELMLTGASGDPTFLDAARERLEALDDGPSASGTTLERRRVVTMLARVEKERADLLNDPEGHRRAIARFEAALEAVDPREEPLEYERVANSLANAQVSLAELLVDPKGMRQALATFARAAAYLDRERDALSWAKGRVNRAIATALLGELTRRVEPLRDAERLLREALEEIRLEARPLEWANTTSLLGNTQLRQARLTRDRTVFIDGVTQLRAAERCALERGAAQARAGASFNLATALEELHEASGEQAVLDEAIGAARSAVDVFDLVRHPAYAIAARKRLADLLARAERHAEARRWLEPLLDAAVEAVLAEPGRHRVNVLLRRASGAADLLALCHLEHGAPAAAIAALDAGRAVALRQTSREGLSPDARASVRRWRRAQLTLDALTAPGGPGSAQREARRERLLEDLHAAHAALRAARSAGRVRPPPAPALLEALQQALAPGGAFVAPVVTAAGGALVIVTSRGPHVTPLPALTDRRVDTILGDRVGLGVDPHAGAGWSDEYHAYTGALRDDGARLSEVTARAWRAAIERCVQDVSELLVAPLHDALLGCGLERGADVVLCPPGRLALLPLAAAPVGEGETRFVDHWTLTLSPNASAFIGARSRQRHTDAAAPALTAITDPGGDLALERSPASAAYTASALVDLVGEDADLYGVTAALGDARDVCFFCHGRWSALDPEEACLELAHGQRLTVARLRTLESPHARLAFLAACEAGMIDLRLAPDSFSGLPASFAETGFTTVISALWPIPVAASARFVERFFDTYARGERSVAEALRETQRAFIGAVEAGGEASGPRSPLDTLEAEIAALSFTCFGA